jgi:hypothetical protein
VPHCPYEREGANCHIILCNRAEPRRVESSDDTVTLNTLENLRNFHQLTAFEQAEMILYAALDPTIASRAKKGEFVTCLDHFELLQCAIN